MQILTNDSHEQKLNIIDKFYAPSEVVLFDIETTGFAAETSTLYMIGVGYFDDNKWQIKQWFNDDNMSEQQIIEDFLEFIKEYKFLFNYNGDGFDIPYIQKKISLLGIDNSLDNIESVDLYKKIKGLKDVLHLENLKQKSIERFLSINRLDKYSGGDLIKVYQDYVKKPNEAGMQLLIQHNYEDLEGLMCCFSLMSYIKFKAGCLSVTKMSVANNRIYFSLNLEYPLPKRIAIGSKDIIVTGYGNEATINIAIVSEELKFFFDNYKEYYYLPAEDMAVHKSVATYVDKNYREAAKKENCYLRRNGHFITQIDNGILPGYKRTYKDKETYIELADSFLKDMDLINAYAIHVIQKLF